MFLSLNPDYQEAIRTRLVILYKRESVAVLATKLHKKLSWLGVVSAVARTAAVTVLRKSWSVANCWRPNGNLKSKPWLQGKRRQLGPGCHSTILNF